jgi:hypothetical protein
MPAENRLKRGREKRKQPGYDPGVELELLAMMMQIDDHVLLSLLSWRCV